MPTALVVLAPGVEEIELITVADVLVRAGVAVTIAATTPAPVVAGSRGLPLGAHTLLDLVGERSFDLVYLPGGTGSAEVCTQDARVQDLAERQLVSGGLLAVICAAPLALVPRRLCAGRRLTSFPAVRAQLEPHCAAWLDQAVVDDGPLVTSQGAGTALHLAYHLARRLCGQASADQVMERMVVRPFVFGASA